MLEKVGIVVYDGGPLDSRAIRVISDACAKQCVLEDGVQGVSVSPGEILAPSVDEDFQSMGPSP